ncbi:MAG TPA: formate-dependent phosphoribosylglycinamide formyltransferase, partial [Methylothermaceae bacterium]|nr:formate-dependent phosphoribosylglycinamide formyltransferase [Methylothermaceae bacterium]
MHIGTPLSASATKIMLLGSGELGKEIAIAAQRLGVEVIAVDRYENAPAQQVAHSAHVIDMTDPLQLRALVEREKPRWIVPEIEALATDALAEIEAAGLATVVPCARAVQLTMDREGIRRLAAEELGLPTSRYAFAGSLAELEAAVTRVGLPCFVKPTMSSSGKGQSRLTAEDQIAAAWDKARSGGRVDRGRVIVERQIDFDFEIALLTVRALDGNGRPRIHFCEPIGHRQEQGDYVESWQPQPMTEQALANAQAIA